MRRTLRAQLTALRGNLVSQIESVMDFSARLQKAVERGRQQADAAARDQLRSQLTEEELKTRHAQARVELSDHIETCLQQVARQFPGFDFQTVVNPEGFGARISRDNIRGRRGNLAREYSHLELIVRSFSTGHVLEVVCRGAISNKEVMNRSQFQQLSELDLDTFRHLVDQWVLEYAEKYATADR